MRNKKNIQILIGVVIAFAAGILAGIYIVSPGLSLGEAAGTIGRVDQYRNVRISEADIELRNELLSDENMRNAYVQYLTIEYTNNIRMAENVQYAMEAARTAPEFRAANERTLMQLDGYADFLENARLRILEALAVVSELSDGDRIALRTVLNNAGNAISQTMTRSNAVFNYLSGVEEFFGYFPKENFPQLVDAHDRLFTNLMAINMINDNRPVLEYLLAKGMMDEESELAQLDQESLRGIIITDSERLNLAFEQEQLQILYSNMDLLQIIIITDQQQLQDMFRDGQTLNMEAMQVQKMFDSEKLDGIIGF